jgi:hypothetical protein
MPLTTRAPGLEQLAKQARRTAFRARINDVFARGALLSLVPTLYLAVGICLIKIEHGSPAVLRWLGWGALVPGVIFAIGVLHAALRHRAPSAGALVLDRHHGLNDRVTNALAFARLPEGERTPLMQAAIEDALGAVDRLSPRDAVPLRLPRDLPVAVGLLAAALALSQLEVPVQRILPAPRHAVEALALSPDDVDLLRRVADDLKTNAADPVTAASAHRFNQLVEDLAEKRLDRREVFRRLDELDRSLTDSLGVDPSALDDSLDGIAKELDKAALSKPVAKALAEKRLADAEQAMKDLAEKIEKAKKDVDRDKLEALRQSLKKAGDTTKKKDDASKKSEKERHELEEQRKKLLQKKKKEGLTDGEQKELERTERKLERLEREKAQGEREREQLSGLDKDLAKAAENLMKDLGMSSNDVRSAAEDIHRSAGQRATEQQKQEMKRRLEELRQMLRQEGQAGRERIKRMLEFAQRARGQQGQGQGQPGKPGQQGQGQQGQGQQGQGQQGQGQSGGQGKDGKGRELALGQGAPGAGDALLLKPGLSMGSQGQSGGSESGGGDPGNEAGSGHDPNLRGDASHLKGQTSDVTATAADTGQGQASSTVIYGAAERGFSGRGYKKVFTDYQTVAEESLAKDDIPSGYRFYVRRYFQLIRPRD